MDLPSGSEKKLGSQTASVSSHWHSCWISTMASHIPPKRCPLCRRHVERKEAE